MKHSLPFIIFVALLAGCEKDNLDTPRELFNNHKIGSTPDYGVMKFGNDHVITVHGFTDDLCTCQEIVTAMNFNTCKETDGAGCLNPYSCAPPQTLNANPIYKNAHIPLRHSERIEGSSDGLYILAGFFATLRMTGV